MPTPHLNPSLSLYPWTHWFTECRPQVLVVTDGLNFDAASDFGLTEFVATLRTSTIHNMVPIVTTAVFHPTLPLVDDGPNRHIQNFKFTENDHGLKISRYDVVFLFGLKSAQPDLASEPGAIDALTAFMQAGGGVFATGDHENLGAALCAKVPRVRAMRLWTNGTPSVGGADRLSTTAPNRADTGGDDLYAVPDQQDALPQRLYPNFLTFAGGVGPLQTLRYAHPLLQLPGGIGANQRAIEVFPDHPHEGECVLPSNASSTLNDGITPEWPLGLLPEMVALSMSHGNGYAGKAALTPRSFMAICAYNGHLANVGRVATDATWHHFVNVNIQPGMAPLGSRDLADIKQYYVNLATWLMPKNVRRCLWWHDLIWAINKTQLFEELPEPDEGSELTGMGLRDLGTTVASALAPTFTPSQLQALLDDLMEEALGADDTRALKEDAGECGVLHARAAALAALGSATLRLDALSRGLLADGKGSHEAFKLEVWQAAKAGARRYFSDIQPRLGAAQAVLARMAAA